MIYINESKAGGEPPAYLEQAKPMPVRFITCAPNGPSYSREGDAWDEVYQSGRIRIQELREIGDRDAANALSGYGTIFRTSTNWTERRILAPSGDTHFYRLADSAQTSDLLVSSRLIDRGRFGLPDVFACGLSTDHDGELHWLSELQPFASLDEAIKFYSEALDSVEARQIAHLMGARRGGAVFGLVTTPESATNLVTEPNPTATELAKAVGEIDSSLADLAETLKRWDGTESLRYLTRRWSALIPQRMIVDIDRAREKFVEYKSRRQTAEKRLGRPTRGGREQMIASTLAELWVRCGLGKPSTTPQSRFMRVCQVVLPWYGIHKADVPQFMRVELKKRRQWGVVIG